MERELKYRHQILSMMRGYRPSMVLISCAELRIFETLGNSSATAQEVAARLGVSTAALARLMNAAVALGLLETKEQVYRNSPTALACLTLEGPFYMGNLIRREGTFYRRWFRLVEAVKSGARPEENLRDEQRATWVRDFELALFDLARTSAPATAAALEPFLPQHPDRPVRVIDVGGGHGAYSIALAQRYSDLQAVVFDLPAIAEVAQENIASSGAADRVRVQAGDFKVDSLGSGFDLALLFGVLVSESASDAVNLLKKVYEALVPGGWAIIRGFYLDPGRTGPLDAVFFDLQMLLSSTSGAAHTAEEIAAWLSQAGFERPQTVTVPFPERSDLIVVRRS